jgi:hypothetical protein
MVKVVKKVRRKEDHSGIFIPAGLLIGIGIGFLTGQVPAGTLIGLGAGFLLMALVKLFK